MWVSELAISIAVIMFFIVLFGITRGRHFYRVRQETISFPDLPEAFDGFTITQITDVHSGSFTNAAGVQKGLDLVNDQRSDVILFTGDLVNNRASEMDRWIPAFSGLKAPMGKFSVLGNHDYGDYIQWETPEAKQANLTRLQQVHADIGFHLLLDEAVTLRKEGQSIVLLGVENWGKGDFHKYGDLKKATATVADDAFKILMSHDPSHWEGVTLGHHQHIHLTLSGHTHGMQFGFELFGFKWSPIKYVYKQWAGLYEQAGRFLYVNRGFGFLGPERTHRYVAGDRRDPVESSQVGTPEKLGYNPLVIKKVYLSKKAVRLVPNWDYGTYRINDKVLKSGDDGSFYADSSIFNVLDFKLLKGDKSHPFPNINSVIFTEKTAKRFFGDAGDTQLGGLGAFLSQKPIATRKSLKA